MIGQISGIVFILAMDAFRSSETGSMTPSLVVLTVLMGVSFALCLRLKTARAARRARSAAWTPGNTASSSSRWVCRAS